MTLGRANRQSLAVLRHPDQGSGWLVVVGATLADPATIEGAPARLAAAVPLSAARLRHESWHAGEPTHVVSVDGDPLAAPALWQPLQLAREAPVRLVVGDGGRLGIAAHHAAFDGLSMLALLRLAAGGELLPSSSPPSLVPSRVSMASSLAGLARRLVLPADRVAPSHPQSAGETRLWREVTLSGAGVTARLAAATAAAVAEQNNGRGRRWRRVGISVSVAGGAGIGNLATYRRVDLAADGPVEEAVAGALATGGVPPELARPLRALRVLGPVASRLGDSFLVSNLGRHELPGLRDVVFFPVARGRSAVAIGAVALASGSGTVSLRARDLDEADALTLLDEVVKRLS